MACVRLMGRRWRMTVSIYNKGYAMDKKKSYELKLRNESFAFSP